MQKEIRYGGFSANPNDHDGLEGDLAVAMNLIPEDNTIKPVLPPERMFIVGRDEVMLCIHETSDPLGKHYIWLNTGNHLMYYGTYRKETDGSSTFSSTGFHNFGNVEIYNVEPVGNTLVVLAEDGVHYVLWNTDTGVYRYLGQKPPRIDITFGLKSKFVAYPGFNRGGNPLEPIYFEGEWHSSSDERNIPVFSSQSYGTLMIPKDKMLENNSVAEDWSGFDFSMEDMPGDEDAIADDIKTMTDAALGAVNKLMRKEGTEKGMFVMPFFVRYALEMYDETMVMHSYPVLMVPNSRGPIFAMDMGVDSNNKPGFSLHWNSDSSKSRIEGFGRAYGFVSKLCYDAIFPNLDSWKDIIHKVNVYVSAPIYTYDQDGKVYGWQNMDDDGAWDSFYTIGKLEETNLTSYTDYWRRWKLSKVFQADTKRNVGGTVKKLFTDFFSVGMPSWILKVPEPNEEKMKQRILDAGNFYLVHSFTIDEFTGNHSTEPMSGTIDIEKGALEALLASDTLPDDYFTRDPLIAKTSFAYNNRVNLAGVSRIQHKPLDAHIAWTKYLASSNASWNIAVKVKGQDRTNVLVSGPGQNDIDMPLFVFYPDPNATTAYIERGGITRELKLTRHPLLWGAYWLGSLWSDAYVPTTVGGFPAENAQPVKEYNAVYTSKVNNPFFFPSTGVNTIGTGEIRALCAAVRPVSTSQFGYADLYIFADSGLWIAKVNEEGSYSNVDLVSGDICINPKSITQMETTVLFTTTRGIMLVSGSQVQCISEAIDDKGMSVEPVAVKRDGTTENYIHQLYGVLGMDTIDMLPFREFLQVCRMIYDYRGQRIIAYSPDCGYAYIYSLQSNKWGMMQADISYSIRAYPDALAVAILQDGISYFANFSNADKHDNETLCQLLVTRPLMLDLPDIMKTVSVVLQRGMFDIHGGRVQCALYASRDLLNWHLVRSSTDHSLRGFSGTPYKWFRVAVMMHLQPGESLTSCTLQFEPKYTNRLR